MTPFRFVAGDQRGAPAPCCNTFLIPRDEVLR
jgi:hypothetical protein